MTTAMTTAMITRRYLLTSICGAAVLASARVAWAQGLPPVVVSKDPTCGCCNGWIEHLRGAGFLVNIMDTSHINLVKKRYGVPEDLASCHTAEVDGYVLEGHVPAAEVKRLLAERPHAKGLAVAGMPMGSPGMEMDGMAETYDVVLFGPSGRKTFARYRGAQAL